MTVNGSGLHGAVRVLVCGDRNWTDRDAIYNFLAFLTPDNVVIHGGAHGADTIAEEAALARGAKVEEYRAQWNVLGRGAGPVRNQQMLDEGKPDLVVAFHDDLTASKGTFDMVQRAGKAGLTVYVIGACHRRTEDKP